MLVMSKTNPQSYIRTMLDSSHCPSDHELLSIAAWPQDAERGVIGVMQVSQLLEFWAQGFRF